MPNTFPSSDDVLDVPSEIGLMVLKARQWLPFDARRGFSFQGLCPGMIFALFLGDSIATLSSLIFHFVILPLVGAS